MAPRRLLAFPTFLALLLAGPPAVAAESTAAAALPRNEQVPSPALMRAVSDARESRQPARAARFYARGPDRLFFDLAPLEYRGWAAYAAGAAPALASLRRLAITLHPGAVVRVGQQTAWGAATMRYDLELHDGTRLSRDARWTVIWEKAGAAWLIVHEHVSFPDPPPTRTAPPPAPPRSGGG